LGAIGGQAVGVAGVVVVGIGTESAGGKGRKRVGIETRTYSALVQGLECRDANTKTAHGGTSRS
jgi:hypothetical protein